VPGWFATGCPDQPAWLISLSVMVLLTLTNVFSVKSYGEFEFWFSSIKVAAISVFLLLAALYVLGLWPGVAPSVVNLTAHGGFAPNGVLPILTGAVAATGFYFGAEIVSIAAAEAAEPAKAVARATNSVITRVLLFYVGSILLVVCLVPWNSAAMSTPYVSALGAMHIPAAAHIMNAVVLTAVLSALNSGLYASSRMLFALTRHGDAPRALAKLSGNGVPIRAILLGTLFGYGTVIMSYVSPDTVFAFLVNSYGTVAIFVYLSDRGLATAPAGALGTRRSGAAACAHVGLSLPHLSRDRRHARHCSRHGLHPRAAHSAGIRLHQPRAPAVGIHCPSSHRGARRNCGPIP
jgi:GABA permease